MLLCVGEGSGGDRGLTGQVGADRTMPAVMNEPVAISQELNMDRAGTGHRGRAGMNMGGVDVVAGPDKTVDRHIGQGQPLPVGHGAGSFNTCRSLMRTLCLHRSQRCQPQTRVQWLRMSLVQVGHGFMATSRACKIPALVRLGVQTGTGIRFWVHVWCASTTIHDQMTIM